MIKGPTIIITILLAITVLWVPRKYFLVPYILAACFIPADQRTIIFDLDFTPLRILVIAGFIRILLRAERPNFQWNTFDKLVLAWALCGAFIYVLQWRDMRALIYKSGILYDVIGLYWLFRLNLDSWVKLRLIVKCFAFFAIFSSILVIYERVTHINPFDILGNPTTKILFAGRYRCGGAFSHYINMGLFWLSPVPLFLAYAINEPGKKFFWISSTVASGVIVWLSASSTPIDTLVAVLILFALFKIRQYGRIFFWALCGALTALHIVMEAPVWHLFARVGVFAGSTGWHRYYLIDQAINHFSEWVLLGTRSTGHWGWGLSDVTNEYIVQGVRGGLVTLALFISVLVYGTKIAGAYSLLTIDKTRQWLSWGICVIVLGHCIAFFGTSYFGQIMMLLYLTFAMVAFIYEETLRVQSADLLMAGQASEFHRLDVAW